jgi:hypothetical protein
MDIIIQNNQSLNSNFSATFTLRNEILSIKLLGKKN